ncbi:MAG: DUF4412 domain-containing protein [Calditrichaeota bacterium]|nr:DUF4412 domain-containing protein [Calditrichota bacterium]
MKILHFILIVIAVFYITIHAQDQEGIYLEQKINSSGMNNPAGNSAISKSWITDSRIRLEQPGQTLIFLFDAKKVFTLMQKEKQYIEMTFADMDNILNLSKMFMASGQTSFVFSKKDETRQINNWNAYKIEAKNDLQHMVLWLTEDIAIDRAKILKMYSKIPGLSVIADSFNKTNEFQGFPVLTEMEMKVMDMPVKTSIELVKIEKTTVGDSLFLIPENFEQIESPMNSFQMK